MTARNGDGHPFVEDEARTRWVEWAKRWVTNCAECGTIGYPATSGSTATSPGLSAGNVWRHKARRPWEVQKARREAAARQAGDQ